MKDCTIIIPTYNRNNFLKVLLKYVEDFEIDSPIIIADGSTNQFDINENTKQISILKEKNFKIEHFINDSFYHKRLYLCSDLIKTDYCKVNMDDDFFGADYIKSSINMLKSNKSISAITGYNVSFHINYSDIKQSKVSMGDKENTEYEDILKRFYKSNSNWEPFAVYRTDSIKKIFKITNDLLDRNMKIESRIDEAIIFRICSYVFKLQTLLEGKIKFINKCMNVTTYHKENWGKHHKIDSTFDLLLNKSFTGCISDLKNIMIENYNYEEKLINNLIKIILIKDKHFNQNFLNINLKSKLLNLTLKKILNILNNSVKDIKKNFLKIPEDGKKIINYLKLNFQIR